MVVFLRPHNERDASVGRLEGRVNHAVEEVLCGMLQEVRQQYRISFLIDQNAGEKTLILQAANPAVSDTLFDSSQAQKLQNQSVYAEVVCRLSLYR
jgi:hypothetical protein